MKPRHVLGALMVLAETPILAVLVAGWAITGALYATVLVAGRTRSEVPQAIRRARDRLSAVWRRRIAPDRPAWR